MLFNNHPTGRSLTNQRLDTLMGPGGIQICGNAQNCVAVCPKEIPLTTAIAPRVERRQCARLRNGSTVSTSVVVLHGLDTKKDLVAMKANEVFVFSRIRRDAPLAPGISTSAGNINACHTGSYSSRSRSRVPNGTSDECYLVDFRTSSWHPLGAKVVSEAHQQTVGNTCRRGSALATI